MIRYPLPPPSATSPSTAALTPASAARGPYDPKQDPEAETFAALAPFVFPRGVRVALAPRPPAIHSFVLSATAAAAFAPRPSSSTANDSSNSMATLVAGTANAEAAAAAEAARASAAMLQSAASNASGLPPPPPRAPVYGVVMIQWVPARAAVTATVKMQLARTMLRWPHSAASAAGGAKSGDGGGANAGDGDRAPPAAGDGEADQGPSLAVRTLLHSQFTPLPTVVFEPRAVVVLSYSNALTVVTEALTKVMLQTVLTPHSVRYLHDVLDALPVLVSRGAHALPQVVKAPSVTLRMTKHVVTDNSSSARNESSQNSSFVESNNSSERGDSNNKKTNTESASLSTSVVEAHLFHYLEDNNAPPYILSEYSYNTFRNLNMASATAALASFSAMPMPSLPAAAAAAASAGAAGAVAAAIGLMSHGLAVNTSYNGGGVNASASMNIKTNSGGRNSGLENGSFSGSVGAAANASASGGSAGLSRNSLSRNNSLLTAKRAAADADTSAARAAATKDSSDSSINTNINDDPNSCNRIRTSAASSAAAAAAAVVASVVSFEPPTEGSWAATRTVARRSAVVRAAGAAAAGTAGAGAAAGAEAAAVAAVTASRVIACARDATMAVVDVKPGGSYEPPPPLAVAATLPAFVFPPYPYNTVPLIEPLQYSILFARLSAPVITTVISAVLAQISVLCVSHSISAVTPCMEALSSLIQPFPTSYVYVPLLVPMMEPVLHAPMPFFVGAHASIVAHLPDESPTIVCNLDTNRVFTYSAAGVAPFPPPLPLAPAPAAPATTTAAAAAVATAEAAISASAAAISGTTGAAAADAAAIDSYHTALAAAIALASAPVAPVLPAVPVATAADTALAGAALSAAAAPAAALTAPFLPALLGGSHHPPAPSAAATATATLSNSTGVSLAGVAITAPSVCAEAAAAPWTPLPGSAAAYLVSPVTPAYALARASSAAGAPAVTPTLRLLPAPSPAGQRALETALLLWRAPGSSLRQAGDALSIATAGGAAAAAAAASGAESGLGAREAALLTALAGSAAAPALRELAWRRLLAATSGRTAAGAVVVGAHAYGQVHRSGGFAREVGWGIATVGSAGGGGGVGGAGAAVRADMMSLSSLLHYPAMVTATSNSSAGAGALANGVGGDVTVSVGHRGVDALLYLLGATGLTVTGRMSPIVPSTSASEYGQLHAHQQQQQRSFVLERPRGATTATLERALTVAVARATAAALACYKAATSHSVQSASQNTETDKDADNPEALYQKRRLQRHHHQRRATAAAADSAVALATKVRGALRELASLDDSAAGAASLLRLAEQATPAFDVTTRSNNAARVIGNNDKVGVVSGGLVGLEAALSGWLANAGLEGAAAGGADWSDVSVPLAHVTAAVTAAVAASLSSVNTKGSGNDKSANMNIANVGGAVDALCAAAETMSTVGVTAQPPGATAGISAAAATATVSAAAAAARGHILLARKICSLITATNTNSDDTLSIGNAFVDDEVKQLDSTNVHGARRSADSQRTLQMLRRRRVPVPRWGTDAILPASLASITDPGSAHGHFGSHSHATLSQSLYGSTGLAGTVDDLLTTVTDPSDESTATLQTSSCTTNNNDHVSVSAPRNRRAAAAAAAASAAAATAAASRRLSALWDGGDDEFAALSSAVRPPLIHPAMSQPALLIPGFAEDIIPSLSVFFSGDNNENSINDNPEDSSDGAKFCMESDEKKNTESPTKPKPQDVTDSTSELQSEAPGGVAEARVRIPHPATFPAASTLYLPPVSAAPARTVTAAAAAATHTALASYTRLPWATATRVGASLQHAAAALGSAAFYDSHFPSVWHWFDLATTRDAVAPESEWGADGAPGGGDAEAAKAAAAAAVSGLSGLTRLERDEDEEYTALTHNTSAVADAAGANGGSLSLSGVGLPSLSLAASGGSAVGQRVTLLSPYGAHPYTTSAFAPRALPRPLTVATDDANGSTGVTADDTADVDSAHVAVGGGAAVSAAALLAAATSPRAANAGGPPLLARAATVAASSGSSRQRESGFHSMRTIAPISSVFSPQTQSQTLTSPIPTASAGTVGSGTTAPVPMPASGVGSRLLKSLAPPVLSPKHNNLIHGHNHGTQQRQAAAVQAQSAGGNSGDFIVASVLKHFDHGSDTEDNMSICDVQQQQ